MMIASPSTRPLPQSLSRAVPAWVRRHALLLTGQVLIFVAFLLAWQYLPQITFFSSRFHFLDPYFVSSPTKVESRLVDMFTGRNGSFTVWKYVVPTVKASILGYLIGTGLGGVMGLVLSNSPFVSGLLRPTLVLLNAVPRIALIPVIIVAVGPTLTSEIVLSVIVVFFIVFWNAYEGGLSVPLRMSQNAQLLGARKWQITWRIKAPYVLAWTMASMPNAVTSAFLVVITAEVLTGRSGLGFLITQGLSTADSTLTFAVAVLMSLIALIAVAVAEMVRRRVLHWWLPSR